LQYLKLDKFVEDLVRPIAGQVLEQLGLQRHDFAMLVKSMRYFKKVCVCLFFFVLAFRKIACFCSKDEMDGPHTAMATLPL
jgi:hypothetical protein